MTVTPEEAIEMIDDSLTILSDAMKQVPAKDVRKLLQRADKLLDNRLRMMAERDTPAGVVR